MGRGYAPDDYLRVVERARSLLPGVAIGADVMAGFPGEDEAAFERTVALLDAVRPAYLHVFPFSERPGVAALRLPDAVDEATKRIRARALAARDRAYREAFLRAADGETHDLLLEAKPDPHGRLQALTDTYVRVAIETDRPAGSWIRARLRWTGDARRMLGEVVP
jgi:threonylcarbamoyladenosine tRNA methylthiotransferase MtaB